MSEVICINDKFPEEWEIYFRKQGMIKPIANKIYGIREIVPNTKGEKGLLLVEIVNRPTPRTSPLTGMKGMAEQNWAVSRFTDLLGQPLSKETISEIIKNTIYGNNEVILREGGKARSDSKKKGTNF